MADDDFEVAVVNDFAVDGLVVLPVDFVADATVEAFAGLGLKPFGGMESD